MSSLTDRIGTSQDQERYWLNEVNEELDGVRLINGWYAVVDEEHGGEIAYFTSHGKAIQFMEMLRP